jgi:hypothetical protein
VNKTAERPISPQTLTHSSPSPPLSPPERASERESEPADVVTGRGSGAVARLLTGGRRSPEGERAVVEQSRCDALIREPEPVNPRVGAGEPRVPFPDSDEVGFGIDSLGKSWVASFFARVWDWGYFPLSIRFFSTQIRTISYLFLR